MSLLSRFTPVVVCAAVISASQPCSAGEKLSVTIKNPKEGEEVGAVYNGFSASVGGELADGHFLWIFVVDKFGGKFQQWPRPLIVSPGKVRATNIRTATSGSFFFQVVIADANAHRFLMARVRARKWDALDELPEGARAVASVSIRRR